MDLEKEINKSGLKKTLKNIGYAAIVSLTLASTSSCLSYPYSYSDDRHNYPNFPNNCQDFPRDRHDSPDRHGEHYMPGLKR
jgi:hypothetical protein